MTDYIDTEKYSDVLRRKSVDIDNRRVLVTNLNGTAQERDLSEPPNCKGFGRIRHFHRTSSIGWPSNPLPIDPANKALGVSRAETLNAQVFQNASCNWRCWYCYVPFDLLGANPRHADWLSVDDLLALYESDERRTKVIVLSGGQPDLVPEWVPWFMQALQERGLDRDLYLWSDDNLSNDYFWRYLSDTDIALVANYKNYGRVCCFKGYNSESFSFNTKAHPDLFDQQFSLIKRYIDFGIDTYAYVTLTCPTIGDIDGDICRFIDRLQGVRPNLPLRTIPLEIKVFGVVESRIKEDSTAAILNQQRAIDIWTREIESRFGSIDNRDVTAVLFN